jgi:hypothetical protein
MPTLAIFVNQSTSAIFEVSDPADASLMLCRYPDSREQVRAGTIHLEAGVYVIVSRGAVTVSGGNVTSELLTGDKDIPAEPRFVEIERGATRESVARFLALAKGATVPDPVPHITNEPDGI